MDNISLWEAITPESNQYPELSENIEVDVVIVGGGITGITSALQLAVMGKKVAILENARIGSGTTGFSTGNLYVPIQAYYQTLLKRFNFETVNKCVQARKLAIDFIETTAASFNIECNFTRRPMYLYTEHDNKISKLKKEFELLKKCSQEIKYVDNLPLDLNFKKAWMLDNQARFNPLQYVTGLAKQLEARGVLIFENSRVIEIEENNEYCLFKTKNGKIKAKSGVLATHTPTGINPIQFFTAPYRSYVVAYELKNKIYPEINCWNLDDPHYALSTHSMSGTKADLLVVAGSHHKTGQAHDAEDHYRDLQNYMDKHFDITTLKYRWSAQHYHSADGIPYIGRAFGYHRIYQATGYFADGLVYGTLAGTILADTLQDKKNDYFETFNSKRHDFITSLPFLLKENMNVFIEYLKDTPQMSTQDFKDIKKGEGKICTIRGEKCGLYRDEAETLHAVSAVCPHMECIVQWNNAEKTWDCPCHGSRFHFDGKYIEGPARSDLPKKAI